MTAPQPEQLTKTIQLLAEMNRLTLRAYKTENSKSLTFLIVNDTISLIKYDRAVLWDIRNKKKPRLLAVSGQATTATRTDLSQHWRDVIKDIKNPETAHEIDHPDIPKGSAVLWIPIFARGELALGWWLERWNGEIWRKEEVDVLNFLAQAYGASWEKFQHKIAFKRFFGKPLRFLWIPLLLLLFFVRLPLRVVAPAEVIPDEPFIIAAPLEGIIEEVKVKPGETVKKGQLLVEYDKRVPLQDLRISQRKVQIIQSEVERAIAQAQKDQKALAELGVENLKLKKEQLELELAQFRASQLSVESPVEGVAVLDSPEEWHGKPVKIGEKIMVIANPHRTKVRIWIPEEDNIPLNMEDPIYVYLDPRPDKGYRAKLDYIASYTHVTEKGVPSFIADAKWLDEGPDIKLGVKGTAILYGEKVSLFYWIIRRPWMYIRRWTGF